MRMVRVLALSVAPGRGYVRRRPRARRAAAPSVAVRPFLAFPPPISPRVGFFLLSIIVPSRGLVVERGRLCLWCIARGAMLRCEIPRASRFVCRRFGKKLRKTDHSCRPPAQDDAMRWAVHRAFVFACFHSKKERKDVGCLCGSARGRINRTRVSPSGKASASQADIRGFESRYPLH